MSPATARRGAQGILYISYDGMLEPLGQSQVVAYLERLTAGRRVHLISFEKSSDWSDQVRRSAMGERLRSAGIAWHPLRYHKSPSAAATAYDIALGSALAVTLARRHRLGIVHARSYVPAVMALAVKRLAGATFVFDMRGFWADERVDGDLWPRDGLLYRAAKAVERKLLLAADHVVTLTYASKAEIRCFDYLAGRTPPVTVIPTCADLERFTVQGSPPCQPFVLGYVGGVGTWYLLDEMLGFFRRLAAAEPGARLLVVNRHEHALIRSRAAAAEIATDAIEIITADHAEMPRQIARMSAGMALIKPAWSKIASAPTKLAEYLGCGIPCLGNVGVGDMAAILDGKQVGVALRDFSPATMDEGVAQLVALTRGAGIQERCRDVAIERFSLEAGVRDYAAIYGRLAEHRR